MADHVNPMAPILPRCARYEANPTTDAASSALHSSHAHGDRMDGRARAGAVGGHSVPGHQPRGRCRIPQGRPRVSVAFVGQRLGFEFDVERYNHFFKDKDVAGLVPNNCGVGPRAESCVDLNTDAIGFMGNVIAPIRNSDAKNWRPYATAGLGVIHSWVTDPSNTVADTNQHNFAFNVSGGVMYSLNNRVALRGDVRYFQAFVNEDKRDGFYFDDYGFLRATFGVIFGFPR